MGTFGTIQGTFGTIQRTFGHLELFLVAEIDAFDGGEDARARVATKCPAGPVLGLFREHSMNIQ
jgi:hypothetical protein